MAQGDTYRLSLKSHLYGTRCVNVFHYRVESPPSSPSEEDDLFDAFTADLLPKLIAVLSNQVTFHCATIQNVASLAGNPQEYFLQEDNVGLVVDAALPANKCLVVALYTATYSRNGRGRKYFAGVPITHEIDNSVTVDAKANLDLLGTALATNLTGGAGGGTYQHVVWSPSLELADTVVRAVAGPQIHSLRGRTPARC